MKKIELKHCEDKTIKKIIKSPGCLRILIWFSDDTFTILEAITEDNYGDPVTYIMCDKAFRPDEFSQTDLIEAGFITQKEVDTEKQKQIEARRIELRKRRLKEYRDLNKRFGSLDKYTAEDFGETETEHELKRRMAKINLD